jgi:Na+-transporting methylmalonyl-CoA/oxaloacetate decarboxylase gamma subunit
MMVLLVISIFASIIKGIGNIFNNIGTVMTPGNDFRKEKNSPSARNFTEEETTAQKKDVSDLFKIGYLGL